MFSDLDESLRELLIADVPIERTEIDIEFDRPSREWASRLSRPTLNLFLYDVRERMDMRDDRDFQVRDGNSVIRRRPPRRIDCSYIVTAWTKEAADEHRILAHVLSSMYRHDVLQPEHLQGDLRGLDYDVLLRVASPDHLAKPADFWGVMDNELHVSFAWVATVPLDVFRPFSTPMVRTAEVSVGMLGEEWRDRSVAVGGRVSQGGEPLAGARVAVGGTALATTTSADGRYLFTRIPPGSYTVRLEPPDGEPREAELSVPSGSYDIEL